MTYTTIISDQQPTTNSERRRRRRNDFVTLKDVRKMINLDANDLVGRSHGCGCGCGCRVLVMLHATMCGDDTTVR